MKSFVVFVTLFGMGLALAIPELSRPVAPFRKNIQKIEAVESKPNVEATMIDEEIHEIIKRDVALNGHSQYGVPDVPVAHQEYGVPAVAVEVHDTPECPQDGRWTDDVSNTVWWAGATAGNGGALPHEEYGLPSAVVVPVPAAPVVEPLPTGPAVVPAPHTDYGPPAAVDVSVPLPAAPAVEPLPSPVNVPTWSPVATPVWAPYPAKTLFSTHYGDAVVPSVSLGAFFK